MKNFEKYKDDIIKAGMKERSRPLSCIIFNCRKGYKLNNDRCLCALECTVCRSDSMRWLNEEYKEPCPLKHDEYVILKNLGSEWKWIARNDYMRNSNLAPLLIFGSKPYKNKDGIHCWESQSSRWDFTLFSDLFQFIKWEDVEPYEIAKLIEVYEKEHGDDIR